ncbi:MAG TPA: XdhC/CoxI family protein [Thermodesulfobacteriota bacterium]|nr:XdhC/CoxI family protein [Thermodesulfobacteriota bacterium]
MDDLYRQINQELSQGRDIVLATIVRQKGSAPRTTGTRFLIQPDGRFSGTIGGGKLEAEVLQAAPEVFSRRKKTLLFCRLRGEEVAQMEMICGGEVEVFLELISAQNLHHRTFFDQLSRWSLPDHKILFATLIEDHGSPDRQDTKFFFYSEAEGGYFPNPPPAWIEPLRDRLSVFLTNEPPVQVLTDPSGKAKFFLETWTPPATVFLFGAGHVSRPLCRLAKMVGFRVVVIDDRVEFPTTARFPEADELAVRSFDVGLDELPLGPNPYIVIITRGHLHDHQILRQVMKKPLGYLGMIGSRRKTEIIFEALRREGFSEEAIKTIHAPIGLAINAQTPEEIAISIIAELIQVRGEGSGTKKNWTV